jgi:hypothetical protein
MQEAEGRSRLPSGTWHAEVPLGKRDLQRLRHVSCQPCKRCEENLLDLGFKAPKDGKGLAITGKKLALLGAATKCVADKCNRWHRVPEPVSCGTQKLPHHQQEECRHDNPTNNV